MQVQQFFSTRYTDEVYDRVIRTLHQGVLEMDYDFFKNKKETCINEESNLPYSWWTCVTNDVNVVVVVVAAAAPAALVVVVAAAAAVVVVIIIVVVVVVVVVVVAVADVILIVAAGAMDMVDHLVSQQQAQEQEQEQH